MGQAEPGSRERVLFLCGDVMTGRGVDQILQHPSRPELFEPYIRSAQEYVKLAEQAGGAIPRPVDGAYVWGDALAELEAARPCARIVNLETAVTVSQDAWPGKSIHYRMNPANVGCLLAARIDCCVLANNHVLDWGYAGLAETLQTLRAAGLRTAGAGSDEAEAAAPAAIPLPDGGYVRVFGMGTESAGVPRAWAAGAARAGIELLTDLSERCVARVAERVRAVRRPGDLIVASIHWGDNWGYDVPAEQRVFARQLVDAAGVDVVHGHSSHHPKGIELYRRKLILYGCGDFLNDYEGITGAEEYRPDLTLMYLPAFDTRGGLVRLTLIPMQVQRMRARRARGDDVRWLEDMLNRVGVTTGTRVARQADDTLCVEQKDG